LDQEEIGWTDAEHDGWIAIEAIAEALPARALAILGHRQGVDVTDATPVQVARTGVVDVMTVAPVTIRRERNGADDPANPIIDPPLAEQRAMTTVMLDHEQADQKTSGRDGYGQAEPPRPLECKPGPDPERGKQSGCDHNLEDAAPLAGFAIVAQNPQPIARRRRQMGWAQRYVLEKRQG
jgi:hypothetical protein